MSDPDIIIIGTGPAGVSAAWPLVEAGLRVLMLDGGRQPRELTAGGSYLDRRRQDPHQWKVFLGEDFRALTASRANSPKFRAATLAPVFEGFRSAYPAELQNFALVGSLARGGLSNAWGAGVANFDDADLRGFPINAIDLAESYRVVAGRIGVSGTDDDDLRCEFGSDIPLQAPPSLDYNAASLLRRYSRHPQRAYRHGVRIGQARNAVLTEPLNGREACNRSTMCLWGCLRHSIYSARYDLQRLLARPNCRYEPAIVIALHRENHAYRIEAIRQRDGVSISQHAKRVILACGTIGTTKLVFGLIGHRNKPVTLLATPNAAFAILLPEQLGRPIQSEGFGLAQLSFSVAGPNPVDGRAFGNIFGTAGIPIHEFVRHAPFAQKTALRLLRVLLPAILIGNCFLPGEFSKHSLLLKDDGTLVISGRYHDEMAATMASVRRRFARSLANYRMVLLPGSFSYGEPGSEAHYAGTIPMKTAPAPFESGPNGEVGAAPGLYIVDGAALTHLPAKPHTFTIMANADRIARMLARQLSPASASQHSP